MLIGCSTLSVKSDVKPNYTDIISKVITFIFIGEHHRKKVTSPLLDGWLGLYVYNTGKWSS